MEKYKDISKPEETNGLNKIQIFVDSANELGGMVTPLSPPPVILPIRGVPSS
jgi:hypothetical protein